MLDSRTGGSNYAGNAPVLSPRHHKAGLNVKHRVTGTGREGFHGDLVERLAQGSGDLFPSPAHCIAGLPLTGNNALEQRRIHRIDNLAQGDGIRAAGYDCVTPEGAFYLFPRSPIPDDVAFVERLAEEERRYYWIYLDECQEFLTPSIRKFLTGTRKYRTGLILAHQNLGQLDGQRETAGAIRNANMAPTQPVQTIGY